MVILSKLIAIALIVAVLYPLLPIWALIVLAWLVLRQAMKPHLMK